MRAVKGEARDHSGGVLIEEILRHLGSLKYCNSWKSGAAGFLPATVRVSGSGFEIYTPIHSRHMQSDYQ